MDENVKFVPKEINPPNALQTHPIENFWVCLAQKVYEEGKNGAAINLSN